jgi:xanthine dehydrogenase accessory factor
MREYVGDLERWRAAGKRVVMATVIKAWGSSPRPIGSKMLISSTGDVAGSVSGGCVEGAVVEEARIVLERGVPKLLAFGVTDDQAWEVGLSCGGQIEVFIEEVGEFAKNPAIMEQLLECLAIEDLVALATVVEGVGLGNQALIWAGGQLLGDLGAPRLNQRAALYAEQIIPGFGIARKNFQHEGESVDVFFQVYAPPPSLVMIGAVHVAIPLVEFGNRLGFRTVVIDPRSAFATQERFSEADLLLNSWPEEALEEVGLNEASYVAVLSHDLKIDIPALKTALRSRARYIGALGSKKTHQKRVAMLLEEGYSEEDLARIHSPIGLDLGGRSAPEIALAIISQIVGVIYDRQARILRIASN